MNTPEHPNTSRFDSVKSEAELIAISEFFARRADEEMERLWESGEWNEQTLEDLKSAHYRTPYKWWAAKLFSIPTILRWQKFIFGVAWQSERSSLMDNG